MSKEAAAIGKAIRELSDLIEDLSDGPWGATADPQVGIQNVIDFTLKPALEQGATTRSSVAPQGPVRTPGVPPAEEAK